MWLDKVQLDIDTFAIEPHEGWHMDDWRQPWWVKTKTAPYQSLVCMGARDGLDPCPVGILRLWQCRLSLKTCEMSLDMEALGIGWVYVPGRFRSQGVASFMIQHLLAHENHQERVQILYSRLGSLYYEHGFRRISNLGGGLYAKSFDPNLNLMHDNIADNQNPWAAPMNWHVTPEEHF